jgi:hypothetical protein
MKTVETEVIPAPQLPRPEAFEDPMFTRASACGNYLLTYDPAARAGAIYQRNLARWICYSGIDGTAWLIALDAMHLRPFDVSADDFEELVAEALARYANKH